MEGGRRVMKVAITVWENRISPVLDSAHMLLIADIENAKITNRKHVAFNPDIPSRLSEALSELNVDVLICGAVSQIPADMIESGGVKLIPFITGNVEEVLTSFANSESIVPSYLMPGCGCKQQKKRRKQKKAANCPFNMDKMPADFEAGLKKIGKQEDTK